MCDTDTLDPLQIERFVATNIFPENTSLCRLPMASLAVAEASSSLKCSPWKNFTDHHHDDNILKLDFDNNNTIILSLA